MKFIGIVGSRRRNNVADHLAIAKAFFKIYELGDVIVSGGCKQGGDRTAEVLAKQIGTPPILYLPNKQDLDPVLIQQNPRAAYARINYARNTLVAKKADVLIACVAPDRKGGTEDTIRKFRKFHKKEPILV